MKIILHRINTREALQNTPSKFGVEVDIRSEGKRLIIGHDPFIGGEDFLQWISVYDHGTLILNVKEEGLEEELVSIMSKHQIEDFFFLDQSFPFLLKTVETGETRCAVRISEYEDINTALNLIGKIQWVWVDCFTGFPLTAKQAETLQKKGGFKLCFVSPELQGRNDKKDIANFKKEIEMNGIIGDAVCTKYPDLWV
jgi:hypothetical protein